MRSIRHQLDAIRARRRVRRARLPWTELEAEAARQACSEADIFFDRAGRTVPGLPIPTPTARGREADATRDPRQAPAPRQPQPTFDPKSRRQP